MKSPIVVTVTGHRGPKEQIRLRKAVRTVLEGEGIKRANISLAIVNDREIHDINRRYLEHDEPTDVISFVLEQDDGLVDGEIVASAETAAAAAKNFGWSAADELLLYVIHGTLHLAGYDDLKPTAQRAMRKRERFYLAKFGLKPQYEPSQGAARP
jgi:probable rRNA maturation factor